MSTTFPRVASLFAWLLLLLTALGISAQSFAEDSRNSRIPQTPVGEVFKAWLVATNSGDRATVQAFSDRYRDKTPVDAILERHERLGGYELLRVQDSSESALKVLLKAKESDAVFEVEMVTTAGAAPTLDRLDFKFASPVPPEFLPARLTQSEALAALQARATELASRDRFAGTVLIARKGKVLLERSWGSANRTTGAAITRSTQFRLGSMNKMFTAVAILQLVEAGKVSLQSPLIEYLPDYPNHDLASTVTIRQLLTHTGGTGDIFGEGFDANRLSLRSHADYLKLYGSRPLDFEPGAQDRYSNYGFVLLGAVIERVSGVSYYDYVQEHIFRKARMPGTASPTETENVPTRAISYTRQSGNWNDAQDTLPYRGMAAGGGLSTARDLFSFARALQSGKLIGEASLRAATTPQNNLKWYGYGFLVAGEGPLRNYGHQGGAPGMNGGLLIYPELDVIVVVLSNLDPPAADRLASFYTLRMPLTRD